MKKITAISILFAFSKIVFGQKDSVVIHQVIVDYFEAISANDLGKQKELTTADYLLLENGAIWNQDTIEIKTNQLKGLSIQRINKIAFIRTYVQDNIAWVAYYNTADMSKDGKQRTISWLESAVLIKRGKNWLIQQLHSTKLPPKS